MLFECIYPPSPLFSSGRQALRVREHKVLGPYVDGLSRLAVASYKVKYLCAFPHRDNEEQGILQRKTLHVFWFTTYLVYNILQDVL